MNRRTKPSSATSRTRSDPSGNPSSGEIDLKLDLYQPKAPPGLRPGVIFIHGGGFESGDKSEIGLLAREYASRGYVAASINYRLTGDNPTYEPISANWPASSIANPAVADAIKSVRWMRENATQYAMDPSRVAIGGFSSPTSSCCLTTLVNLARNGRRVILIPKAKFSFPTSPSWPPISGKSLSPRRKRFRNPRRAFSPSAW
jgi:carboxylesterase type B